MITKRAYGLRIEKMSVIQKDPGQFSRSWGLWRPFTTETTRFASDEWLPEHALKLGYKNEYVSTTVRSFYFARRVIGSHFQLKKSHCEEKSRSNPPAQSLAFKISTQQPEAILLNHIKSYQISSDTGSTQKILRSGRTARFQNSSHHAAAS